MTWNGPQRRVASVIERDFTIENQGRTVPGVLWSPPDRVPSSLVLIGHGGTVHKKADYIRLVAMGLAGLGIASAAIDGPGHGERLGATGSTAFSEALFASAWESDGGTAGIVADWAAALDFIEAEHGARRTGWWGLSMGTMMGIPVIASEPRIQAAVLGLMGNWGPNGDDLLRLAPYVRCPVRFLLQLSDQIVPERQVRTLYDAIGARQKTLHENPGPHAGVPISESMATLKFLNQNLKAVV